MCSRSAMSRPEPGQDRHRPLGMRHRSRYQLRTGHRHVLRQPGMILIPPPLQAAQRLEAGPPIRFGRRQGVSGKDVVRHRHQQFVLVADVPVQRHGRGAEVGGHPPHGQRRESFRVGDPDRGQHYPLSAQANSRSGAPMSSSSARIRLRRGCAVRRRVGGDDGPDAGQRPDQPVAAQHGERLGRGRHRDAEIAGELPGRRDPIAGRQLARRDPSPESRRRSARTTTRWVLRRRPSLCRLSSSSVLVHHRLRSARTQLKAGARADISSLEPVVH